MIRLSHSALDTFLVCERMFQLDRLLEGPARQDFSSTIYGKAYGAGVQSYLAYQDEDKALFDCFLTYTPIVEDDKKNQESCLNLLRRTIPYLNNLLQDWSVASFNNKPAIELSFRLNINEDFYFVGYIDVVLKNNWTGRMAVLEVKHTGLQLLDLDTVYKNSGQALGYSIVLDKIAGEQHSEYDVVYMIGQLDKIGWQPTIHTKVYPKDLNDRLQWFIALQLDVERLTRMRELNVFPRRGSSCLQYMKPCRHFSTCQLHALDRNKEEEEDDIEYQFVYELEDVINEHILRIQY